MDPPGQGGPECFRPARVERRAYVKLGAGMPACFIIYVCLEVARREAGSPFIFSRARSIPLAKIASERCGMSVLLFATDLAKNPAQQCSEEVLRTVAKYEALSWHSLKERQRLVAR